MKQLFTSILFILLFLNIQAQKITGKLIDKNKQALSFATVALFNEADSALIKGALTDEAGLFEMDNIANGKYYIISSYLGYDDDMKNFEISGSDIILDDIVLNEQTAVLTEVVVKAKKPLIEVLADKTILNMDASLTSGGLNGLELLRKAPGVTVDNNENVQLKGKNGVRIYIDGKPSYLNNQELAGLLKGMTAADIEAIEIITNPSAKYDAQGNAGIINLRLRKNKNFGTNGNLNLYAGYGKFHKSYASLNLNNRNKKINTFGSIGFGSSKYYNESKFYREQNKNTIDQVQEENNKENPLNGKVGIDYYANDKNTIGALINFNTQFKDNVWTSSSRSAITTLSTREVIDSVLQAGNTITRNSINANANINYRYADTIGNEIIVDLDKGYYRSESTSMQPNVYRKTFDGEILNERNFTNETPSDIDINTAKIDYNKSLKKIKSNLSIGAKHATVKTKNTFLLYNIIDGNAVKDFEMSNKFNYTEDVSAAYINLSGVLTKKINYQGGLRYEHTHSIGDLKREAGIPSHEEDYVERDYNNLFPSGALTYTFDPNNVLNLTYSKRIQRPSYQDLNPFDWRLDELTFRKGNPFLKPQYSNNLELSYTVKQAATIGVGYSNAYDLIVDIVERDPGNSNKAFINYKNLAEQEQISLTINSPLPITKWWNGYLSATFFKAFYKARFPEYTFDLATPIATNLYMEHSITLPKNMAFEVSGWFNSGNIWGGSMVSKAQGSLDLGWKKNILQGNGSIKVGFTDLLHTAGWGSTSTVIPGFYFKGSGQWESQRLNINFTYRFGNSQVKSERQRKTGLEDEKNRIKG